MRIVDRTAQIRARFAGQQKRFFEAVGAATDAEVKRLMVSSPRGGRLYRRGRIAHKASAPGEPPAPDTGSLVRSVGWAVRREAGGWTLYVGSALKKARWLEVGTRRLRARPAFRPAWTAIRSRLGQFKRIAFGGR